MADLLPFLPDTSDAGGDEPRVIGMDSDDADALLSALSSRTARRILQSLHREPTTPSALAERVDTSLQNVQYHLERLEEVGAVEVAETAYSEKGREMKVYAPADRALVVVAGGENERTGIRAAIRRLLGALGTLAFGSFLLQLLVDPPSLGGTGGAPLSDGGSGGTGGGGDAGSGQPTTTASETATSTPTETAQPTGTPTPQPTATETATSTPIETATPTPVQSPGTEPGLLEAIASLPPGALFFLGGATVLAGGFVWWYWRTSVGN